MRERDSILRSEYTAKNPYQTNTSIQAHSLLTLNLSLERVPGSWNEKKSVIELNYIKRKSRSTSVSRYPLLSNKHTYINEVRITCQETQSSKLLVKENQYYLLSIICFSPSFLSLLLRIIPSKEAIKLHGQ